MNQGHHPAVARVAAGSDDARRTSYVFLSDIHLGSDLVPHARPWARHAWLRDAPEVDARLVSLLDHYRTKADPDERVCVVVAGDFLDLVGVSLAAEPAALRTAPTREEQRHGLGSASDHVVLKVRAIAARHDAVFCALARLLADGHQLVVVRGNHDVELHWRAAQAALADAIAERSAPESRAAVRARLTVCPWFFAVDGLFYVEHGHEFDPMCSFGNPLLPTCSRDARRIRAVPFSLMLRQVARPTRGLSSASYEDVSLATYLCLLGRLGLWGTARIALRFGRAVRGLIREWRNHSHDEAPRRELRARASLRQFLQNTGVDAEKVRKLRALYTRPAAHSLRFVLKSVYVDRVLAVLFAFAASALSALLARYGAPSLAIVCAVVCVALAGYGVMGSGRDISAKKPMRRGANDIATLFGARFVIMGHTHSPEAARLPDGATYVNLGHWGEDDVPEERSEQHVGAPCTFFYLRAEGDSHRAEFLRWDTQLGPRSAASEWGEHSAGGAVGAVPERA